MPKITIKGHDIPLKFTMLAMEQAEECFGSVDEMMARLNGKAKTGAIIDVLTIMANAAREAEGEEPIFTREWFGTRLHVSQMAEATNAVGEAFNAAMRMETNGGELDDEEHDPVLEALERKKEKA